MFLNVGKFNLIDSSLCITEDISLDKSKRKVTSAKETRKSACIQSKDPRAFIQNYFNAICANKNPFVLKPDSVILNEFKVDRESNIGHYLMTSGTTGSPKSYFFSLQSAYENAKAHNDSIGALKGSNVLFPLPVYHSFGVTVGVWGTVALNANSYFFSVTPAIEEIIEASVKYEIDILYLTPAHVRLLIKNRTLIESFIKNRNYPKKISIGAAPIFQSELYQLMSIFKKSEIYHTYGLTELGPRVSTFYAGNFENPNIEDIFKLTSLGTAIDGVKLKIGKQLLVSSLYKSEDISEEYFDTNDTIQEDKGRIYFSNRIGQIINYSGKTIYPEEVESLFIKNELIENCCLIPVKSDLYGEIPVLIIAPTSNFTDDDFYKSIKGSIPKSYMPMEFFTISKIPLTSMGKIQRSKVLAEYVNDNLRKVIYDAKDRQPPQTDTERLLVNLWREQIGVEAVYRDSDFFFIGGTSLVASAIFANLNKVLKTNLTIDFLFESSVLKDLAKKIDKNLQQEEVPKYKYLVKIKNNNVKKNFYFFHAIGGNPLNYKKLSEQSTRYNFYGLKSRGLDGYDLEYLSVEEMVSNYIKEILEEDPDGPYYLGGGSFGGTLAYEAACQLQNLGKEVKDVVLLDTKPKGLLSYGSFKHTRFGIDLYYSVSIRILYLMKNIYKKLKKPSPHFIRQRLIEDMLIRAKKNYEPQTYNSGIVLFRGDKDQYLKREKEDFGWGEYVQNVNIKEVNAPHDTFVENTSVVELFANNLNYI